MIVIAALMTDATTVTAVIEMIVEAMVTDGAAGAVIAADLEIVAAAEVAMIADSGTTGEITATKNRVTTEIAMTTGVAHLNSIVSSHTDHMTTDVAATTAMIDVTIGTRDGMTEDRLVMIGTTDPTRGVITMIAVSLVMTGVPHLAETTMIAVTGAALEALRETETSTVIRATKFGQDSRTRGMNHQYHGRLLATHVT